LYNYFNNHCLTYDYLKTAYLSFTTSRHVANNRTQVLKKRKPRRSCYETATCLHDFAGYFNHVYYAGSLGFCLNFLHTRDKDLNPALK